MIPAIIQEIESSDRASDQLGLVQRTTARILNATDAIDAVSVEVKATVIPFFYSPLVYTITQLFFSILGCFFRYNRPDVYTACSGMISKPLPSTEHPNYLAAFGNTSYHLKEMDTRVHTIEVPTFLRESLRTHTLESPSTQFPGLTASLDRASFTDKLKRCSHYYVANNGHFPLLSPYKVNREVTPGCVKFTISYQNTLLNTYPLPTHVFCSVNESNLWIIAQYVNSNTMVGYYDRLQACNLKVNPQNVTVQYGQSNESIEITLDVIP